MTITKPIRSYYAAYEGKDQRVIEFLLAEDFTFRGPLDDHINRVTYFRNVWPNCEKIRAYHIGKLFAEGHEGFVLYELEPNVGPRFRNTEVFRMKDNKIREVEVYFGSHVGTAGGEK